MVQNGQFDLHFAQIWVRRRSSADAPGTHWDRSPTVVSCNRRDMRTRLKLPDDDYDDVAQHGGHTPANNKSWFTAYVFNIWHPCYGQLIPVQTRYPLTSITRPYGGFRFIAHQGHVFFTQKMYKCKFNVKHRECLRDHPSQRLMIKCLTIIQIELEFGNVGFWEEGKTGVRGGKPLGEEPANNKLNPRMTPGLGIEPETHWWEASVLTTAPVPIRFLSCFSQSFSRD